MKTLYTSFFLLLIVLTTQAQNIKILADSLMNVSHTPELGYAIITTDSIIQLETLGYHRVDLKTEQTKANLADYFHLGSNTKAITGFIAAYLVENNKIKWTTKFFDLFPEWKSKSNPGYYQITLADLLSHRARIQPYMDGTKFDELPKFTGGKSAQRKQFSQFLLQERPVTDSTKIYHYSNAGYSIASLMLEKVSYTTWEVLVKEIITKQLGIPVIFGWPNKFNVDEPYGYSNETGMLKAVPPDTNDTIALVEPAADISMTLSGYAKFIQLNLQGLEGTDNFLKADTYYYLHFGLKAYAIGWGNLNQVGKQLSQHTGSAGTFYCYTLIDKTNKFACIIVANSGADETYNAILALSAIIRKRYVLRETSEKNLKLVKWRFNVGRSSSLTIR